MVSHTLGLKSCSCAPNKAGHSAGRTHARRCAGLAAYHHAIRAGPSAGAEWPMAHHPGGPGSKNKQNIANRQSTHLRPLFLAVGLVVDVRQ
jgi:hypothetical protein